MVKKYYTEVNHGNGVWEICGMGDFQAPADGMSTFIGKHPDLRVVTTTLLRSAKSPTDLYWLMAVTESRT